MCGIVKIIIANFCLFFFYALFELCFRSEITRKHLKRDFCLFYYSRQIFSTSDSVVRPIMQPSHGCDPGSNPGRRVLPIRNYIFSMRNFHHYARHFATLMPDTTLRFVLASCSLTFSRVLALCSFHSQSFKSRSEGLLHYLVVFLFSSIFVYQNFSEI